MITLTEAAHRKVQKLLAQRGGAGIRLGVKTTGCSGLAYVLEYVDRYEYDETTVNYAQPGDHNTPGFCVLVDKRNEPLLANMTVDYVRQGLNEGFEFRNPNERDRCGCGESFRV
jgi:iron-sulfur cluster assembly protein